MTNGWVLLMAVGVLVLAGLLWVAAAVFFRALGEAIERRERGDR